jgi:hypothetical protein
MGWRFQIPVLVDMGFRVVAPDMMGYGGTVSSARLQRAYMCGKWLGLADVCLAVTGFLHNQVGTSEDCTVAMLFASDTPSATPVATSRKVFMFIRF